MMMNYRPSSHKAIPLLKYGMERRRAVQVVLVARADRGDYLNWQRRRVNNRNNGSRG